MTIDIVSKKVIVAYWQKLWLFDINMFDKLLILNCHYLHILILKKLDC